MHGAVKISGAKNSALPILAASTLSHHKVKLFKIPDLTDVELMISLIEMMGSRVYRDWADGSINIDTADVICELDDDRNFAGRIRASIWLLAPMLLRCGRAKVGLPGGDAIGDRASGSRGVDLHLKLLESMGAEVDIKGNYIEAKAPNGICATTFTFPIISVGATITAIMAASCAVGTSVLNNCAIEPEIVDLCEFLNKSGAKIKGIGTTQLVIDGVKSLDGCTHSIIPDRIEAGTYIIAALMTRGEITVQDVNPAHMEGFLHTISQAGAHIEHDSSSIYAKGSVKINPISIETKPFPGFPTDLQAQFMSLMTIASGKSIITESIYDNRLRHAIELCKMGAMISTHQNVASVLGVTRLIGCDVYATDIRASVCLLIAGIFANGTTKIHNTHHIYRGYENFIQKFDACGVKIVESRL